MTKFHCEQLGFYHAEDPWRSCRTHLWVFCWAMGKPGYLYTNSLALWLRTVPGGVQHLPCGLKKHLPCCRRPSNSNAQRWERWRCKEVSLHENYKPQLREMDEYGMEYLQHQPYASKGICFNFPFRSPTSIYGAFIAFATYTASSNPYHSLRMWILSLFPFFQETKPRLRDISSHAQVYHWQRALWLWSQVLTTGLCWFPHFWKSLSPIFFAVTVECLTISYQCNGPHLLKQLSEFPRTLWWSEVSPLPSLETIYFTKHVCC